MDKKHNAVDLTDLAVGIVILGIVVSIGAVIILNLRDSRLTDLDVITTGRETIGPVNMTGTSLTNRWVKSVTNCTNSTGAASDTLIPSANYTLAVDNVGGGGIVTLNTDVTSPLLNNTAWNCTYDWYNTSRSDWDLADNAATGLAEYGNWFDIIVIVGIAGLILALIFLAFGRSGGGGDTIGGTY